jgi:DNA-binding beta-propeller fold protein YncE
VPTLATALAGVARLTASSLLSAAAVACAGNVADTTRSPEPHRPDHGTVVRIDPGTGEIQDVYRVGGDPLLLAVASDQVWVMNSAEGTLSRIDPAAERATTIHLHGQTAGMTSDGTDVWVTHGGSTLSRLDGATGNIISSFRLADRPLFELRDAGFLAARGGSVWVTIPDLDAAQAPQRLWRIDATTGAVLDRSLIGGNPGPPAVDGRYAWIPSLINMDLERIDLGTGHRVTVRGLTKPYAVATGGGSTWVGSNVPAEVERVDPDSTEVLARVPVDEGVRGIAYAAGAVWATTRGGLHRIDPSGAELTMTVPLGTYEIDTGPTGIGFADGSIWVSIE